MFAKDITTAGSLTFALSSGDDSGTMTMTNQTQKSQQHHQLSSTRTMLVSIAEEMNPTRRNTQEDVHVVHGPGSWGAPNASATFLGVMDGHGGRDIVDYLEQNLAKNVAQEWTHTESNSKSACDGGGSSVDLQPPKKRRLGEGNNDCDSIKENYCAADTIDRSTKAAALLDSESIAIQNALERAFLITDIQSRIDGIITSGATVACCIVVPNFSPQTGNLTSITIHAANVGDARAVLSSGTARAQRQRHSLPMLASHERSSSSNNNIKTYKTYTSSSKLPNPELANELPVHRGTNSIRITQDHKSTDPAEISRIQSSGGVIIRGRVLGVLAVARSLGDHGLKEFVIAKPYLSSTTVRMIETQHHDGLLFDDDENGRNNDINVNTMMPSSHQAPFTDDEFLVVACDGLWDVMEDQEVVDFIRNYLHAQRGDNDDDYKLKQSHVASLVVKEALRRGSTDNITVIVYWL